MSENNTKRGADAPYDGTAGQGTLSFEPASPLYDGIPIDEELTGRRVCGDRTFMKFVRKDGKKKGG